jgi:hypothetical protein
VVELGLSGIQPDAFEQKAKAWLENKPEARAADYFACSGCHVE